MYTFSELIKKIRSESGLTQAEFASALNVSAVLIAMIETGQKEVSKGFLLKLADRMDVHPASITPFLFMDTELSKGRVSGVEKLLVEWGEKMQDLLIYNRAKRLKKYVKVNLSEAFHKK